MAEPRHPAHAEASDVPGLLASASRGDDAAWRELLARYGRRVYALAKSRCGSPELAEEVAQSVFATVASKLIAPGRGYTEQGRFEAWLFRVTMNRVRDHARARRRHAESVDPAAFGTLVAGAGRPAEESASADLARLRDALEELSDVDREVIELRHHGGMSFKQMAELLGEPIGTLLARHHRALRKLKDLLAGAGARAERSTT